MAERFDHDDFGGLHRDLHTTAAAMNRRSLLRLAARASMAVGTLQLIGCGENQTAPSVLDTATNTTTTAEPEPPHLQQREARAVRFPTRRQGRIRATAPMARMS